MCLWPCTSVGRTQAELSRAVLEADARTQTGGGGHGTSCQRSAFGAHHLTVSLSAFDVARCAWECTLVLASACAGARRHVSRSAGTLIRRAESSSPQRVQTRSRAVHKYPLLAPCTRAGHGVTHFVVHDRSRAAREAGTVPSSARRFAAQAPPQPRWSVGGWSYHHAPAACLGVLLVPCIVGHKCYEAPLEPTPSRAGVLVARWPACCARPGGNGGTWHSSVDM